MAKMTKLELEQEQLVRDAIDKIQQLSAELDALTEVLDEVYSFNQDPVIDEIIERYVSMETNKGKVQ